jgi:hypothetical protein
MSRKTMNRSKPGLLLIVILAVYILLLFTQQTDFGFIDIDLIEFINPQQPEPEPEKQAQNRNPFLDYLLAAHSNQNQNQNKNTSNTNNTQLLTNLSSVFVIAMPNKLNYMQQVIWRLGLTPHTTFINAYDISTHIKRQDEEKQVTGYIIIVCTQVRHFTHIHTHTH